MTAQPTTRNGRIHAAAFPTHARAVCAIEAEARTDALVEREVLSVERLVQALKVVPQLDYGTGDTFDYPGYAAALLRAGATG
jgi:hypothetical protein